MSGCSIAAMVSRVAAVSTSGRPFEFVANHIVLDFINTVNARPMFVRDDLMCAEDFVAWAQAAGVPLDPQHDGQHDGQHHGHHLGHHLGHSAASASEFEAAVDLRERLYRVFGPIAAGNEPAHTAVAAITRKAADAIRSAKWHRRQSGYEPYWSEESIKALCDRLVDEALQLLRSPAVERIGSCDGCGWLFLDASRAHARRWCSMNACGVRHKMRRYHQRQSMTVDAT